MYAAFCLKFSSHAPLVALEKSSLSGNKLHSGTRKDAIYIRRNAKLS